MNCPLCSLPLLDKHYSNKQVLLICSNKIFTDSFWDYHYYYEEYSELPNDIAQTHTMYVMPYKIFTYNNYMGKISTILKYNAETDNFDLVLDNLPQILPTSTSKLLNKIKTLVVFS